jgi:hypothetical protein
MLNWKGFGTKWLWPNGGSIAAFAGAPAEIRTANLDRYRYASLFGPFLHDADEFELRSFWLCNFLRSPSVRVA